MKNIVGRIALGAACLAAAIGCRSAGSGESAASSSFAADPADRPARADGDDAAKASALSAKPADGEHLYRATYNELGFAGPLVALDLMDAAGKVTTANVAHISPCTTAGQTTTCKSQAFEFVLDRQNAVASLAGPSLAKAHPMRCVRGDDPSFRFTCAEGPMAEGKAAAVDLAPGQDLFQVVFTEGGFAGSMATLHRVGKSGEVAESNVDVLKDCRKDPRRIVCKGESWRFTWMRQRMTATLTRAETEESQPLTCASRSSPSLKVTCDPDTHMPP